MLPREALITICKAFVKPPLDYSNVLFNQEFNASSHEKLESIQYRHFCLFNKFPAYLFNLIPPKSTHHFIRNSGNIPCFNTKSNFFKKSFFALNIIEWYKLDASLQKCDSLNIFQKRNSKIHTTFF